MPDRRGHGRTPDAPGPITMELMAQDMIAFLEQPVGGPARLVGYSAGGTVALRVAMRRPDLVERLVLVSAAYDLDGLIFKPSADGEPRPPTRPDVHAHRTCRQGRRRSAVSSHRTSPPTAVSSADPESRRR